MLSSLLPMASALAAAQKKNHESDCILRSSFITKACCTMYDIFFVLFGGGDGIYKCLTFIFY